jgi:hypothetical protein
MKFFIVFIVAMAASLAVMRISRKAMDYICAFCLFLGAIGQMMKYIADGGTFNHVTAYLLFAYGACVLYIAMKRPAWRNKPEDDKPCSPPTQSP